MPAEDAVDPLAQAHVVVVDDVQAVLRRLAGQLLLQGQHPVACGALEQREPGIQQAVVEQFGFGDEEIADPRQQVAVGRDKARLMNILREESAAQRLMSTPWRVSQRSRFSR